MHTYLQSDKLVGLSILGLVHHAISSLATVPIFLDFLISIHD